MATIKVVPGFKPSTSGFHFSNSWSQPPSLTLNVLGQQVPIFDASNGMCGGMVFAVRDFFEAHIPVWADTTPPPSGPLFDYIVKRLFDSFDLLLPPPPVAPFPAPPFSPIPIPPFSAAHSTPMPPFGPGPTTYMFLMNLPDHETVASNAWLAPRGRAWIMVNDQWPRIKDDIDNDRLSPIGLIEINSIDPTQMGHNHQVLAWGYKLDGTDVTIHVYDPNHPDIDNVTMSLSIADPQHSTSVTYSTGETVLCFFRPEYSFSSPPPPPPPPPPPTPTPTPTPKCFIATAACGAESLEVSILRKFRDECLLSNPRGRVIVALYERVSPPMAAVISRSPVLGALSRSLIVSPAFVIAKRSLTSRAVQRDRDRILTALQHPKDE